MTTADNILLRSSTLSKLMPEPKLKSEKEAGLLSDGAITELVAICREIKECRSRQFTNKHVEKGIKQEDHAIDLLCDIKNQLFIKNTQRINNGFITGIPDVYYGENIYKAEYGFDTKCSSDLFTLPNKIKKNPLATDEDMLDSNYYWQNMGYMWLTGAKWWSTSYCLVNGLAKEIRRLKLQWYYALDINESDDNAEEYLYKCIEVEKNNIFDMALFKKENPNFDLEVMDWKYDMKPEDRLVEFVIQRNEAEIERIKQKVIQCRQFIKKYNLL